MLSTRGMAISTCGSFPGASAKVFRCLSDLLCPGANHSVPPATEVQRAQIFLGWRDGTRSFVSRGNRAYEMQNKGRRQAFASLKREPAAAMDESQVQTVFLRNILGAMTVPYLHKNPTAANVLELIRKHDQGSISYDHFAYRTFGVDGCGISSIAHLFLDLGYEVRDELRFPAKKIRALWFSPPDRLLDYQGDGINGPLPRVFISELLVNELSPEAQKIIRNYTSCSAAISQHAALASSINSLTWPTPTLSDYQELAGESEYAAWTLVNGYSLNHATVSVHRLTSELKKIEKLNAFLQEKGIKLNSDGGILKVSPDGGLQQSSTVADTTSYAFAGGEVRTVPGSYIEFAERLVLPKYENLEPAEIHEWHRRDGFEVGNADRIFESTSAEQIGVQVK